MADAVLPQDVGPGAKDPADTPAANPVSPADPPASEPAASAQPADAPTDADHPAGTPSTNVHRRRRTAAYLDLDKTILATSVTLALGSPMRRSGLISTTALARGVVAQLPYLLVGGDQEHMSRLMTHLAQMSAGIERSRLQEVVREALTTAIAPAVYAEALDIIEAHHRAGHDVVVVSASSAEVVEPVAELVGADRAIATSMEVDDDGRFTGRITHSLLHGAKVGALEVDALIHGIDLDRSWAYSDSITDQPMLEAVGHPVAVNPDRELRRLAAEKNWPVRDFLRPVDLPPSLRPQPPSLPAWAPSLPPPSPLVLASGLVVATLAGTTAYLILRRQR